MYNRCTIDSYFVFVFSPKLFHLIPQPLFFSVDNFDWVNINKALAQQHCSWLIVKTKRSPRQTESEMFDEMVTV